jgi:hypothetical protein
MSKTNTPMHFHLVAGTVIFTRNGSEVSEQLQLNTTLQTKNKTIPAVSVGQAQQGLQMLLFQRFGTELEVTDVFIQSISYLGHMTTEAFADGIDQLQESISVA